MESLNAPMDPGFKPPPHTHTFAPELPPQCFTATNVLRLGLRFFRADEGGKRYAAIPEQISASACWLSIISYLCCSTYSTMSPVPSCLLQLPLLITPVCLHVGGMDCISNSWSAVWHDHLSTLPCKVHSTAISQLLLGGLKAKQNPTLISEVQQGCWCFSSPQLGCIDWAHASDWRYIKHAVCRQLFLQCVKDFS